jgi:hypothetical protein
LFMAAGWLVRGAIHSDARALAFLGALFGALAVFPLMKLFEQAAALEPPDEKKPSTTLATLATVLAVASPLYWFNALRPLSDIPGLAVTLAAQAALAAAYCRQRLDSASTPEVLEASGKMIVLGAFLAALAIGFRSQAAVLTLPLLALVLLQRAGRGAAGALLGSAMTFSIGTLLWAVPLIVATGGVTAYEVALASQGGADFSGVDMLYRNPTPRRLAVGLLQTFIYPWGSITLGWVVLGLAAVGMLVLLVRARRSAILLITLALPYLVFHLLFQETVTTRYALPLIPVVAFLAVRGIRAVAPPAAVVAALVVWALALTLPAARVYARDGSPAFAALTELRQMLRAEPGAVIAMHQGIRRAVETQDFGTAKILDAPVMREWLELAGYWRSGGTEPVWFLQDPARTDTELIDPLSRTLHAHYVWSFPRQQFMSGVRPDIVDLVRIESPPGWFGEDGWHLTSETLNRSERLGKGEAVAYIKSRPGAALLVIGGESLAGEAHVSMSLDDRSLEAWQVPARGRFLRRVILPAGTLAGGAPFKKLVVSYADPGGRPQRLRLTEFALEPVDATFFVQDSGWNEIEYNRDLQRRWRWTTGRATTFVNSGGRDVTLTIAGESPLTYFDSPPHVVVRAGARRLAIAEPSRDFSLVVRVPADVLAAADGMLTIETDKTFVPHERSGAADMRTLGLRIFQFDLK